MKNNKLYNEIISSVSKSIKKVINEHFGYDKETREFNWEQDILKSEEPLLNIDEYPTKKTYKYDYFNYSCKTYNEDIFKDGLDDCITAFNKLKKWGVEKNINNPKSLYTIMRKNYYNNYRRKFFSGIDYKYYEYTMYFDEYEYYKKKTNDNITFENFLNKCKEDISFLTNLHKKDSLDDDNKYIEQRNSDIRYKNNEDTEQYNSIKNDIDYFKQRIQESKSDYIKLCELQSELVKKYTADKVHNNKYIKAINQYIWKLRDKLEDDAKEYWLPGNSAKEEKTEEEILYNKLRNSNDYIIEEYECEKGRCLHEYTYIFINSNTHKVDYVFKEDVDSSD